MATIAVGDIHGNLEALTDILDQIHGEGGRGDTIVFLGDYIDRGPDTKGCVDAILGFQREVEAEVVCLLGNHEDWLLRTLRPCPSLVAAWHGGLRHDSELLR
jgi:serine/threonine protein phosphatase 1